MARKRSSLSDADILDIRIRAERGESFEAIAGAFARHPDYIRHIARGNVRGGVAEGLFNRTDRQLAREIARSAGCTIVAPTVFDGRPQGWSQDDYMRMWLSMIEENVGDVYMSPDWSYSNGCAEEYLKAINLGHGFGKRADIVPRRVDGRVLHLHEGMVALSESLHLMQERGLKAETLYSVFLGLYSAWIAWHTPDLMRDLPKTYNAEVVGGTNSAIVRTTMREAAPLLRRVYGWTGEVKVHTASGAVRSISAWPEGVVLGYADTEEG